MRRRRGRPVRRGWRRGSRATASCRSTRTAASSRPDGCTATASCTRARPRCGAKPATARSRRHPRSASSPPAAATPAAPPPRPRVTRTARTLASPPPSRTHPTRHAFAIRVAKVAVAGRRFWPSKRPRVDATVRLASFASLPVFPPVDELRRGRRAQRFGDCARCPPIAADSARPLHSIATRRASTSATISSGGSVGARHRRAGDAAGVSLYGREPLVASGRARRVSRRRTRVRCVASDRGGAPRLRRLSAGCRRGARADARPPPP